MLPADADDLVLMADRIITLDEDRAKAEAILIRDGAIVAVGDRTDVAGWRSNARVLDFGDATIVPGLVDTHAHPVMGMRASRGVDLGDVTDIRELEDMLRSAAQISPEWVRGWNLSPELYAVSAIDVDFFERVLPGRPVFVKTFDFHGAFASRRALELADVDASTRGVLEELDAVASVESRIPRPDADEEAEELLDLLGRMARSGLTLVHSLIAVDDEIELLERAERRRDLPLRYRVAPVCAPDASRTEIDRLIALQRRHGRRWRVEGVKFFLDGTVDNGTAWLSSPDTFGESTSSLWSPASYAKAAASFAEAGIPTYTHAIGDAAVSVALDVLGLIPPPRKGTHRIEHIEVVKRADVARFGELNVTASIQPAHCCLSVHADGTDNWSQRLGPERVPRGFIQPEILAANGKVSLSSDWPIGPFDPREILAIAELRRLPGRPAQAPVKPSQALTRFQALAAYSKIPSEAAGRREGVIKTGMEAHLTVFEGDFLAMDADRLPNIAVTATVLDGRCLPHLPMAVASRAAV